jgi:simple sugar transport system permease protein
MAATGEMVNQRAGVINLGIEGAMLAGALGSAVGAMAGGTAVGVGVAIAAGMVVSAVFAAIAIGFKADQIITGTAITLASVGLTGTLYRKAFGTAGPTLDLPTLTPVPFPGLHEIPFLGPAIFDQPVLTYVPGCWCRSRRFLPGAGGVWHCALRESATRPGPQVFRSVESDRRDVVGGALSGLAGATLVLAQVAENDAGRGSSRLPSWWWTLAS